MSYFPFAVSPKSRAMKPDEPSPQTARPDAHTAHDSVEPYSADEGWPPLNGYATGNTVTPADTASWPSQYNHGLPVQHLDASTAAGFPSVMSGPLGLSMPEQPWATPFTTAFSSSASAVMARIDSGFDCYNGQPTTYTPVSASWDPHQVSGMANVPIYQSSPARTECSQSSHASVLTSSTYAGSESVYHSLGSPMIKVEGDGLGAHQLRTRSLSAINAYPGSGIVRPHDIYSSPSLPATEQEQPESPVPMFRIDDEDAKPVGRELRPAYARSQSLQDTRLFDDERPKRGYTTEANAVCSCDQCGMPFARRHNLKQHMTTHDPDRVRPFKCPFESCTGRSPRRTDLNRHIRSVSTCSAWEKMMVAS